LIGQAGLQLIYFTPIQFWGWYVWVNKGENTEPLKISRLRAIDWVGLFIAFIVAFLILKGVIESQFSSAQMVAWDCSVVVASVIAQILLSYKKIESWYWWFLPVNVSAIGLYYVADSPMTVILYVAYLMNCGYAIYEWRKQLAEQK
jgi:nicotinamide mononucleotide transporter